MPFPAVPRLLLTMWVLQTQNIRDFATFHYESFNNENRTSVVREDTQTQ